MTSEEQFGQRLDRKLPLCHRTWRGCPSSQQRVMGALTETQPVLVGEAASDPLGIDFLAFLSAVRECLIRGLPLVVYQRTPSCSLALLLSCKSCDHWLELSVMPASQQSVSSLCSASFSCQQRRWPSCKWRNGYGNFSSA